jgi:hypothetical protein
MSAALPAAQSSYIASFLAARPVGTAIDTVARIVAASPDKRW